MSGGATRYIFVIGGIMSGIGKGITASSIGTVLSHNGYRVNIMKIDPYLNVDAGTMSPTEHGEVFVLTSGLETDQDMGNYERFLNRDLCDSDYMTGGSVYRAVIERERSFKYGGGCVEAIPHVVDEIRGRIEESASRSRCEVQIVEIGGTLGDYQNTLFLEAGRQMHLDSPDAVLFTLVSYLPCPKTIGEIKTRPTQNAVRMMNSYGINPSVIFARSEGILDRKYREKIARACSIKEENVISAPDVSSIYDVPLNLQDVSGVLVTELGLRKRKPTGVLERWKRVSTRMRKDWKRTVRIGIVGKYFETGSYILSDSYLSVIEAIRFSSASLGVSPEIVWLNTKKFEGSGGMRELSGYDGLIVPGGFGTRGVDGKLAVIRYAREHGIPLLGICYGMQLMVVEYMRSVVGKKRAHTIEVDPKTPDPVITIMESQKQHMAEERYGGSMRLGAYTAHLGRGTLIRGLYGRDTVDERHRHRYEMNDAYISVLEDAGLRFSAYSSAGLVEAVELPPDVHPFFVGVQYHPEFTARPLSPSPLFTGLIRAAKGR